MCEEEMAVHQESPMENVLCDVLVTLSYTCYMIFSITIYKESLYRVFY